MRRSLVVAVMAIILNGRAGKPKQSSDNIQVNVPPEVSAHARSIIPAQPDQCCVCGDQEYSEGAVIKVEGVLLQCQRDEKPSAHESVDAGVA
ncbi:DUF1496 domain-containing protein [Salmonella enterica subsp. enterica]|nr:DUF1496 domain-containing protein [Salmonella enterica subsp. enterica]